MKKILINSKEEMADLARKIAAQAQVGDVIALKGTLGAGKSFFARNFINFLSAKEVDVLSPTFNLVYSYDSKKSEIFHFDLYRLKNSTELENIGFFDAIKNGISLIEWPEIAVDFLPKNYLEIEIKITDEKNEEAREVFLKREK
jgi:tRNA threonylcarbamoyl adenosine modification protein YjeE